MVNDVRMWQNYRGRHLRDQNGLLVFIFAFAIISRCSAGFRIAFGGIHFISVECHFFLSIANGVLICGRYSGSRWRARRFCRRCRVG